VAREQIAERRGAAQVSDPKCVFLWGFKIAFGGQRSTGFGVIYDSLDLAKKSLSKHLLMREGLKEKPKGPRPSLPHPPLSACAFLSSRALAWWGSCWLARSCFALALLLLCSSSGSSSCGAQQHVCDCSRLCVSSC